MNLAQTKLTLDEWNSIEIPVSEKERQILKLIQKESESGTDPLHLKNQILKCLRAIIYLKHGLSSLLEETESTVTSLMNISKEINVETVNKISKVLIF